MSRKILIDGDTAIFEPAFGLATVVVRPGRLAGSGPATYKGRRLCVDGDERRVTVPGCSYSTPSHPIPGLGTLKIAALGPEQKAGKTRSGGKNVMLEGRRFEAVFEVQTRAGQPTSGPPVPDPTPSYVGGGRFLASQSTFGGA